MIFLTNAADPKGRLFSADVYPNGARGGFHLSLRADTNVSVHTDRESIRRLRDELTKALDTDSRSERWTKYPGYEYLEAAATKTRQYLVCQKHGTRLRIDDHPLHSEMVVVSKLRHHGNIPVYLPVQEVRTDVLPRFLSGVQLLAKGL